MIKNGAIKDNCEVVSFDVADGIGELKLSALNGVYYKATE